MSNVEVANHTKREQREQNSTISIIVHSSRQQEGHVILLCVHQYACHCLLNTSSGRLLYSPVELLHGGMTAVRTENRTMSKSRGVSCGCQRGYVAAAAAAALVRKRRAVLIGAQRGNAHAGRARRGDAAETESPTSPSQGSQWRWGPAAAHRRRKRSRTGLEEPNCAWV